MINLKCWIPECDNRATKMVYPCVDPMNIVYCCNCHHIDSFTEHQWHVTIELEELSSEINLQ